MKIGTFTKDRQADWDELESLVAKAKGRPERLDTEEILRMGSLYRAAIADLSRLRSGHPAHPATHALSSLVTRARPLVYRSEPRRLRPVRFVTTDFWQICMERPVFMWVAAGFLLGSAALGWIWAALDTSAAVGMVPGEFANALDPEGGTDMGADLAMQTEFSWFLITHNVTVAILAFAVGIFFGVGTVAVLVQNGILFGVIAGALVVGGDGGFFVELAAAHGVLELSCIVIAAAGGLRMGWALVAPGNAGRREAVVAAARPAVLMTIGIVPWLGIAGIIESFVSRRGLAATPMAIVGVLVGGFFWVLMWRRGRVASATQRHAA